jgi:hypothetical protein
MRNVLFPRPFLIVDNTRPVNALYDPNTFMGDIIKCAFEAAANPDRGPLPAEALELFKAQVRAQQNG